MGGDARRGIALRVRRVGQEHDRCSGLTQLAHRHRGLVGPGPIADRLPRHRVTLADHHHRRMQRIDPVDHRRPELLALGVAALELRIRDDDIGDRAGRLRPRDQPPMQRLRRDVEGRLPLLGVRVAVEHDRLRAVRVAVDARAFLGLQEVQMAAALGDRYVVGRVLKGRRQIAGHGLVLRGAARAPDSAAPGSGRSGSAAAAKRPEPPMFGAVSENTTATAATAADSANPRTSQRRGCSAPR